jgi:hypothetical protein
MKKIMTLSILVLLFSFAAPAQQGYRGHRARPSEITRFERLQLQKDLFSQRIARRHAERDGIVTPYERRKLHKMKQRTRRDVFRFRLNGRNRLI